MAVGQLWVSIQHIEQRREGSDGHDDEAGAGLQTLAKLLGAAGVANIPGDGADRSVGIL